MTAAAPPLASLAQLGGSIGTDAQAAQALIKLFEDIARHKASISEAIGAGVSTAEAVAQYAPGAAQTLQALEAAQALDAVYLALPANWRFVKTRHGPLKDVFDGKTPPQTVFGHEIIDP
jgi:hypothetical protein